MLGKCQPPCTQRGFYSQSRSVWATGIMFKWHSVSLSFQRAHNKEDTNLFLRHTIYREWSHQLNDERYLKGSWICSSSFPVTFREQGKKTSTPYLLYSCETVSSDIASKIFLLAHRRVELNQFRYLAAWADRICNPVLYWPECISEAVLSGLKVPLNESKCYSLFKKKKTCTH